MAIAGGVVVTESRREDLRKNFSRALAAAGVGVTRGGRRVPNRHIREQRGQWIFHEGSCEREGAGERGDVPPKLAISVLKIAQIARDRARCRAPARRSTR